MKHWLKCILFLGTFCSTAELLAIGGEDSLPRFYFTDPLVKIEVRYIQPLFRLSGAMDSVFFQLNRSLDIGRALSKNGQVNVFQYGPQGTACLLRMNGLSPDHTQLSWKEISLNSITLGQTDFSLVPAFFFDHLTMGSSKSVENGGYSGFGGNVNLIQYAKQRGPLVGFWMDMNSLQNQSSGGECNLVKRWSKENFWSHHFKWIQGSFRNRFSYEWKDLMGERAIEQRNNDVEQYGLSFNSILKKDQFVFSGQYWFVQRQAELPNTMGNNGSYLQEQDDQTHRWQLGMDADRADKGILRNWSLNYVGTMDNQQYRVNYQFEGLDDWSESQTNIVQHWFSGKLQYRFRQFSQNVKLNYRVVDVNYGFNSDIKKNIPQLLSDSRWLGKRFNFYVVADRQYWGRTSNDQIEGTIEWIKGHTNPSEHKYYLRLQLASFYQQRMPDFNELYWPGSGNLSLNQESAKGVRSFFEWMLKPDTKFHSNLIADLEYNQRWVDNWIQWVPNSNGVWSPMNLSYVLAKSMNGNIKWNVPVSKSICRWKLFGQWNDIAIQNDLNHSDVIKSNKLPYTPRWKWGIENTWMSKDHIYFSLSYRWTSLRFTDESNSLLSSLPAYALFDIALGQAHPTSKIQWSVGVENLADVQYQEVRSYALPGRVLKCQINIQIK